MELGDKIRDEREEKWSTMDSGARLQHSEDVFVDPIAEVLPEEARWKYLADMCVEVRKKLVEGLRGTKRWQKNGYILDPNFRENNLEHVVGLLDWANQIERDYPELWFEIADGQLENWHKLLQMLILHDIGETEKRVGDLSRSNPLAKTRAGRLHKRKEAFAAYLMIGKYLPENLVEENRALYHRFDKRHPDDKLAMIGHVLDKGQATQRIPYHVIPFNLDNPKYHLPTKIEETQTDTLDYGDKLMANLRGGKARGQLRDFLMDKVVDHYDKLSTVPDIEVYQRRIRAKFPGVFNP